MSSKVLYLKAEQNAEVMQAQVCVKDIASVYCSDSSITSKVKALKIYQFQEEKRTCDRADRKGMPGRYSGERRRKCNIDRTGQYGPAQNHGADGQTDFCHADQFLRNRLYYYGISQ